MKKRLSEKTTFDFMDIFDTARQPRAERLLPEIGIPCETYTYRSTIPWLGKIDHLDDTFGIKLSTGTPVFLLMASASFREGVACSLRIFEIIERSHLTSLARSTSFIFRVFMCFASLFMIWIVNVMNVNVKHNVNDNAWSLKFSREKM